MKKIIVLSALAIQSALMAQDSPTEYQRHGVYLGIEGARSPAQYYNIFHEMKTGSSMPGIHLGYLYEGPEGICWRTALRYHSDLGRRSSSHFQLEAKYRFRTNVITLAPMIGIRSDVFGLDKHMRWTARQAHGFCGIELMKCFNNGSTIAAEIKAKHAFAHQLSLEYSSAFHSVNLYKFSGFELDLPIRVNLGKTMTKQLEIRPIYHYGDDAHKIGMQAHIIHWF